MTVALQTATLFKGQGAAATGVATDWQGGKGVVMAHADNWNGASLQVQQQTPDQQAWINVGSAITADTNVELTLVASPVRAVLTGTPTNLSAWAIKG